MSFATLLVHLDSSPRCAIRADLAIALATRFGARLTGVFAETATAHRVGVVATWPSREHLDAVEAAAADFARRAAPLGDAARFVDLDRGSEHEILAQATDLARHFDLVVLGGSETGGRVPADLCERILRESGRPVLLVPPVGAPREVGRRPLFAWHPAPSAARALSDALPLIASDADASVVHVARPREAASGFEPMVLERLAAHGIAGRSRTVMVEEVRLMDTLLNEAADHAADLLVVGAFDHIGSTFSGAGAGTRYLLQHATLPLLLSH